MLLSAEVPGATLGFFFLSLSFSLSFSHRRTRPTLKFVPGAIEAKYYLTHTQPLEETEKPLWVPVSFADMVHTTEEERHWNQYLVVHQSCCLFELAFLQSHSSQESVLTRQKEKFKISQTRRRKSNSPTGLGVAVGVLERRDLWWGEIKFVRCTDLHSRIYIRTAEAFGLIPMIWGRSATDSRKPKCRITCRWANQTQMMESIQSWWIQVSRLTQGRDGIGKDVH